MKISTKRPIVIIAILIVSLLLGFAVDSLWDLLERATHPNDFKSYVKTYSSEYNIPEYVIFAVIETESGFDKNAECAGVSLKGVDYLCRHGFSAEQALLHYLPGFEIKA